MINGTRPGFCVFLQIKGYEFNIGDILQKGFPKPPHCTLLPYTAGVKTNGSRDNSLENILCEVATKVAEGVRGAIINARTSREELFGRYKNIPVLVLDFRGAKQVRGIHNNLMSALRRRPEQYCAHGLNAGKNSYVPHVAKTPSFAPNVRELIRFNGIVLIKVDGRENCGTVAHIIPFS